MNNNNNKNLIEKVEKLAKFIYPKHNFVNHILPAVKKGAELAEQLSADTLVVEAATYLHDIGRIIYRYKNHEKRGSYISKLILPFLGFNKNQIEEISYCILVHNARVTNSFKTIEAEIVVNADALSQFENFLYMFSIFYCTHGRNIKKTKEWLKNKYERDWETKLTIETAKNTVRENYEIIKKILNII